MPAKDYIPDWFLGEIDNAWHVENAQVKGHMSGIITDLTARIALARHRNCFYCLHFDHRNDQCMIAKPPSRPPTFVLVHGCRNHFPEDEIPF